MKRILIAILLLAGLAGPTHAADTAKQIDFLLAGYRHPTSDEVLSGGKVKTFLTGTSTLSSLWTDQAKGGTATNPVVLDSSGKAEVYGDNLYKFEIYDSNDILLETISGLDYKTTLSDAVVKTFVSQILDNVSGMVASTTLIVGDTVRTLGYYSAGDGGGNDYRIVAAAAGTDDGGSYIDLNTHQAQGLFKARIDVKSFGAKGNDSTLNDDELQACHDYAGTVGGTVFYSDGVFKTGTGIVHNATSNIDTSGSSTLRANDQLITTLTIPTGNYTNKLNRLPSIANGAIGLLLEGTNFFGADIGNIGGAIDSIVLRVTDTNTLCVDNTIRFQTLSDGAGSGIKFDYQATTTAGVMQGNAFYGNFIVSKKYPIHFFDVNNGGLGSELFWDDSYFEIIALDSVGVTDAIGIFGEPNLPPARTIYNIPGYFDLFDEAFIKGGANNNIFRLAFATDVEYAKMQTQGVGNRIINLSSGQDGVPGITTPVALTTAPDTLASFNSGDPINSNRFLASITVAAPMVDGDDLTFYFYHPLMQTFGCKVTAELQAGLPLLVQYAIENSTSGNIGPGSEQPFPFQGVIRVLAVGDVIAATYNLYITVHDAPQ